MKFFRRKFSEEKTYKETRKTATKRGSVITDFKPAHFQQGFYVLPVIISV